MALSSLKRKASEFSSDHEVYSHRVVEWNINRIMIESNKAVEQAVTELTMEIGCVFAENGSVDSLGLVNLIENREKILKQKLISIISPSILY